MISNMKRHRRNRPTAHRNLELFNVGQKMEKESNVFHAFLESRKKSEDPETLNNSLQSCKIDSNKDSLNSLNNNYIGAENDLINENQNQRNSSISEEKITKFQTLTVSPKFSMFRKKTTESNKKDPARLVLRFIEVLLKFSYLKKFPHHISKQVYEIIGDNAHYQNKNQKKFTGYLLKILESFDCCLRQIKRIGSFFHHHQFIIHPYKNYKIFWDFLHFMLMIFLFFYLPLDIVFEFESSKYIRIFLSFFMIFDNFMGFSTAYFKHGKLITDRKRIFKAYIGNFMFDLFTQISLIYDVFLVGEEKDVKRKFIKLICLVQYRKFKQIYHTLIDRFKIDMKFGYLLDFINLIATSICIMHWVACAWYFIGTVSYAENRWLNLPNIRNKLGISQYIYAFYWSAVTMMTVGYGDVVPQNEYETVFATIIVVLGCGLFAYYINSVGFLLQEMNKNSIIYKNGLKTINQMMEKNHINVDLRLRIKEYLRFIWKEEKTQLDDEEKKILSYLPIPLKNEFLLASYAYILTENPLFFINFSKKCLNDTISEGFLKQMRFTPGDIIFDEDDRNQDFAIYFIIKGEVEIYHNKSIRSSEYIKLATLKKGYFGEIAFFSGRNRTASAKASDFTTLYSLKRADFLSILHQNQEDFEKFCMIRDQINMSSNLQVLRLKCYLCKQSNHLVNSCHFLHFCQDNEKIIKSFEFSYPQVRKPFENRQKKKRKTIAFKALDLKKQIFLLRLNPMTNQYSSGDVSDSEENSGSVIESDISDSFVDNDEKNKYKLQEIGKNKEKSIEESNMIASENNTNNQIISINSLKNENFAMSNSNLIYGSEGKLTPMKSIKKDVGVMMVESSINKMQAVDGESLRTSIKKDDNSHGDINMFQSKVYFSKKTLANNCLIEPNDIGAVGCQKERANSFIKLSEEYSDCIYHYKTYFYQNNFFAVKEQYERNTKISKRKKLILQKLAQYTFYIDSLYQKTKRRKASSPFRKKRYLNINTRIVSLSDIKNESAGFKRIVNMVMKKKKEQKESKSIKKLYNFCKHHIKKILKR